MNFATVLNFDSDYGLRTAQIGGARQIPQRLQPLDPQLSASAPTRFPSYAELDKTVRDARQGENTRESFLAVGRGHPRATRGSSRRGRGRGSGPPLSSSYASSSATADISERPIIIQPVLKKVMTPNNGYSFTIVGKYQRTGYCHRFKGVEGLDLIDYHLDKQHDSDYEWTDFFLEDILPLTKLFREFKVSIEQRKCLTTTHLNATN